MIIDRGRRESREIPEPLELMVFLEGSWVGEGHDDGSPVLARASGRFILDGSWFELREALAAPDGASIHDDTSLYRYDPSEEGVRVIHCMARGWRREYPVRLSRGRLSWIMGPGGPKVELYQDGDGYRSSVRLPGDEDASVVIRYRPSGGGRGEEPGRHG